MKVKSKIKNQSSAVIGKVGKFNVLNWHGYKVLSGIGKSSFILDEIQHRRNSLKQNMIIVVGAPGEGKSYFALRLAEILDKKFNPFIQVVFDRTHLLWLIGADSPLKMGQVIVIDEAQFIAGARRWFEDLQKDIMEHIEAIRSKGFVVLIVALHINLLDKVIRKYVLSHMMKMNKRGSATVYHLWTPTFKDQLYKRTLGGLVLQLPDYEKCKSPLCLTCPHRDKCLTIRAIYERLKKEFLGKMSTYSRKKAEKKEKQKKFINFNELIEKVVKHKELIVYTSKGNPEPESISLILEDHYKITLTRADVTRVIKRGQIRRPEVFSQVNSKATEKDTKKVDEGNKTPKNQTKPS